MILPHLVMIQSPLLYTTRFITLLDHLSYYILLFLSVGLIPQLELELLRTEPNQACLILLYFTWLPSVDTIFLTNQRFVAIVYWTSLWCHFPNSICSLCVSMFHVGNSPNTSNFFIIIIFITVIVISDLWCFYWRKDYDLWKAQKMISILAVTYFKIKVHLFFFFWMLSVQMFFQWICRGESGLPVLFLRHLPFVFLRHNASR